MTVYKKLSVLNILPYKHLREQNSSYIIIFPISLLLPLKGSRFCSLSLFFHIQMILLITLSWKKSFTCILSEETWACGFQSAQEMNILFTKNDWSKKFSWFVVCGGLFWVFVLFVCLPFSIKLIFFFFSLNSEKRERKKVREREKNSIKNTYGQGFTLVWRGSFVPKMRKNCLTFWKLN